MYYGNIKNCDIANGEGVRVSIFVSGCTNHCKNCFQPEPWDFNYGKPYTHDTENELLRLLEPGYINGLSVLGGEPLEPANQPDVLKLIKRVRDEYPKKDIWVFSGFTFEELKTDGAYPRTQYTDELLGSIDVLVDGRFDQSLYDISLRFRGSSNQRLIDMPATLSAGKIVLFGE